MKHITIIGAGAWGTALGLAAHRAGNKVTLWTIDGDAVAAIQKDKENPYLPAITLPDDMEATTDLGKALTADIYLVVVSAQVLPSVCARIKEHGLDAKKPLIICNKGIEEQSLKLMSELIAEAFPSNPIAIISGPNFADEVAKGAPSATTLACKDEALGMELVDTLGSKTFRTYYSSDIIGAQIGGAVKNVLAIACGIASGKGFGENTKAALITRGLSEIARLCIAKGGDENTLRGLCGIGDIMLTCSTPKSRNMSLGCQLGEGKPLQGILAQGKTVEGVVTAKSVHHLSKELGVTMPIMEAVYQVLYEAVPIDQAIERLLDVPFGIELG